MRVTIPSYKSIDYLEVFEVTAWRSGQIYKTRSTGKVVNKNDKDFDKIDKSRYVLTSLPTNLTRYPEITLTDVAEAKEFM